ILLLLPLRCFAVTGFVCRVSGAYNQPAFIKRGSNPTKPYTRHPSPRTGNRFGGRVARQSSAKAPTAVRIRSEPPPSMKYSQWIGVAASLLLVAACFLPWTWHPDLNKEFTGFFSENNV